MNEKGMYRAARPGHNSKRIATKNCARTENHDFAEESFPHTGVTAVTQAGRIGAKVNR